MKTIIRVGEKNNFNQTKKEFKELEKYQDKGNIFVNSNAFTTIKPLYPSIVTINPYMEFIPLKGDLSNVKAVRLKVFRSSIQKYQIELIKCIEFCQKNNLKILLTYMRYRSKKTVIKYSGEDFKKLGYEWKGNYYRPNHETKTFLYNYVLKSTPKKLVYQCDSKGKGCPDCMNCTYLTYGTKKAQIKALNLSISGIKDKAGKRGICPYKCPDCFAKVVTFGKRPQCDKLIFNKKIQGKI